MIRHICMFTLKEDNREKNVKEQIYEQGQQGTA